MYGLTNIPVDTTPMKAVITNSGINLPVYHSPEEFVIDIAKIVALDNNANWAIGRLLVMMDQGIPDTMLNSMGISRDEWDNLWIELQYSLLTDGAELKPKWVNAKWVCRSIPEGLVVPWTILPYSYYMVLAKVMNQDHNSFEAWLEYAIQRYADRKNVPFSVAEFRKTVNASLDALPSEVKDNEEEDSDESDDPLDDEKPITVPVSIKKWMKEEVTVIAEEEGTTVSKWIAQLIEDKLEGPKFK